MPVPSLPKPTIFRNALHALDIYDEIEVTFYDFLPFNKTVMPCLVENSDRYSEVEHEWWGLTWDWEHLAA
jgi:hypothetical protein